MAERGAAGCTPGPDVLITLAVQNVVFVSVGKQREAQLGAAYARVLAQACALAVDSVVDLYGRNGTATVTPGGLVFAYALGPWAYSAGDLTSRLSALAFREQIAWVTLTALSDMPSAMPGLPTAVTVSVQPEKFFTPLALTEVTSTTALSAAGGDVDSKETARPAAGAVREPRSLGAAGGLMVLGDLVGAALLVLVGGRMALKSLRKRGGPPLSPSPAADLGATADPEAGGGSSPAVPGARSAPLADQAVESPCASRRTLRELLETVSTADGDSRSDESTVDSPGACDSERKVLYGRESLHEHGGLDLHNVCTNLDCRDLEAARPVPGKLCLDLQQVKVLPEV